MTYFFCAESQWFLSSATDPALSKQKIHSAESVLSADNGGRKHFTCSLWARGVFLYTSNSTIQWLILLCKICNEFISSPSLQPNIHVQISDLNIMHHCNNFLLQLVYMLTNFPPWKRILGVSKRALQWYSTMDSWYSFKRKRFHNTRHTVTFGILL
jgi:hypothetical protein